MGRYCTYSEVITRYRKASDVGSVAIDSNYIVFAENDLDSKLGKHFTVPFSSNNLTAKDLAIDLSYARVIRFSDAELATKINDTIGKTIDDLVNGNIAMLTSSGDTMYSSTASNLAWSNTMSYSPSFGMDDEMWLGVTSAQLTDEYEARYE